MTDLLIVIAALATAWLIIRVCSRRTPTREETGSPQADDAVSETAAEETAGPAMAPPGDKRPFFVARPYSSTSPAPLDFDVDELNRDTGAKRRSSVASSTLY